MMSCVIGASPSNNPDNHHQLESQDDIVENLQFSSYDVDRDRNPSPEAYRFMESIPYT